MLSSLKKIRGSLGEAQTVGLADSVIERFVTKDKRLEQAITRAVNFVTGKEWQAFLKEAPNDEEGQIKFIQQRIFNFYYQEAKNPYIPAAAVGPWIVTTNGAVLHDSGGYGMLGFGHCIEKVEHIIGQSYVMANVMTASLSQRKITEALDKEIGHTRNDTAPVYSRYMFLNSGSEAMTLAGRLADRNAKHLVGDTNKKPTRSLTLDSSFHGRTERPARLSNICLPNYQKHLHSFDDRSDVGIVVHNDIASLEQAFADAEQQGVFIDALYFEGVNGEGDPGRAISPEFYQRARSITDKSGTLLVVDSVQAGIRAHGVLSIVDYPGFQKLDPPDVETFSKAVHLGHLPLSVIAISQRVTDCFRPGLHGNTMTANPRSLEVGAYTLRSLTDDVRNNIVERGKEFVVTFKQLQQEFPNLINKAQGTGLLVCIGIDDRVPVVGNNGLELRLRQKGLGIIHGDKNVLRLTPTFTITSEEIALIAEVMREVFRNLKC